MYEEQLGNGQTTFSYGLFNSGCCETSVQVFGTA